MIEAAGLRYTRLALSMENPPRNAQKGGNPKVTPVPHFPESR
jgi:hypothetical protein